MPHAPKSYFSYLRTHLNLDLFPLLPRFFFALIVLFSLACSESGEVEVDLTVSPSSIARGQSVKITLLSDTPLDSNSPSIDIQPEGSFSTSNVQKVDNKTVTFQLSVGSTAPLGKRIIALTAGKTSGEAEITFTEAQPDTETDKRRRSILH